MPQCCALDPYDCIKKINANFMEKFRKYKKDQGICINHPTTGLIIGKKHNNTTDPSLLTWRLEHIVLGGVCVMSIPPPLDLEN